MLRLRVLLPLARGWGPMGAHSPRGHCVAEEPRDKRPMTRGPNPRAAAPREAPLWHERAHTCRYLPIQAKMPLRQKPLRDMASRCRALLVVTKRFRFESRWGYQNRPYFTRVFDASAAPCNIRV